MSQKTYTLIYAIEIDADCPRQAAEKAAEIMLSPAYKPHFYWEEFADKPDKMTDLSRVLSTLPQIDLEQQAS